MKRIISLLLAVLVIIVFSGCATIVTHNADLEKHPKGIRVYPPRVYLMIETDKAFLVFLPDYQNAYDIKPRTIIAKNKFSITIKNGQITSLTSDVDTTAVVDLLKELVSTAGEVAKGISMKGVQEVPTGMFNLPYGIYRLNDDGTFEKIAP